MSYLAKVINIPSATYLDEIFEKDKRELAAELLWLRETSKVAIKKSWNEVEDLQRQCADYAAVEARLNTELTSSRSGEEVWRLRCLAAEKIQLMPLDQDISRSARIIEGIKEKTPLLSFCDIAMKKIPSSNRSASFIPSSRSPSSKYKTAEANMQQKLDSRISSLSTGTLFCESMRIKFVGNLNSTNHVDIPEEKECFIENEIQNAGETSSKNQLYLNGNVQSQEDLSLIISSRDKIIVSLEQTLNQQLKILKDLQGEMVCKMMTHRIKEKKLSSSYKQKEDCLKKLAHSLQRKLGINEMVYKKRTQEHTDELEKACKSIK